MFFLLAEQANSQRSAYSHDWLDNYGKNDWEYWKAYIQDKGNTIWEAILNIATSANGEKILYDINPIKKMEQSVESDTSPSLNSIAENSEKSTENAKKVEKFSRKSLDVDG